MRKTRLSLLAAAALVAATSGAATFAAPRTEPELIPGAYLMTSAERDAYRKRMLAAPNAEAKARIRAEQLKAMDVRAKNVGLRINDELIAKREPAADGKGTVLRNVCFSCHGSERYELAKQKMESFLASSLATAGGVEDGALARAGETSPNALPPGTPNMARSKVRNLAGLKRAIVKLNDYFSPQLTDAEINDLVAYLNAAYYKF